MIEYRYEPLDYLLKTGLPKLCEECWEKFDDGFYRDIFSPDWKMYKEQEEGKRLGFFVMREKGELIGYSDIIINADIHQEGLKVAVVHDFFVTEEKRGHAIRFYREIEKFAKQLGAYRIDIAERISVDASRGGVGMFYRMMGFNPMEIIWSKILEEGEA